MTYTANVVPTDPKELTSFLQFELGKITKELRELQILSIQFDENFVLPSRPQKGMIMNFSNTIVGITTCGLHEYTGSSWVKL